MIKESFQFQSKGGSKVVYSERIAEVIRQLISDGSLEVGAKLPTVREIAEWTGADISTVQKALSPLAAEGFINRYRRKGTFVARNHARDIDHLIVLRDIQPSMEPGYHFCSFVSGILGEHASRLGMTCEFEPVPVSERARREVEARIGQAAWKNGVGLIVLGSDHSLVKWTEGLSIPVVFHSVLGVKNKVYWDYEQGARLVAAWAAKQGAATIGLISGMPCANDKDYPGHLDEWRGFFEVFIDTISDFKIKTRDSWIAALGYNDSPRDGRCHPSFGYHSFQSILAGTPPDVVVVYPSSCVEGVMAAATQATAAPGRLPRLLLHRTLEIPKFSPVPAAFFASSAERLAGALIKKISAIQSGTDTGQPDLLTFDIL